MRRVSPRARARQRQWVQVTRQAIERAGGRCVVRVPGLCLGVATEGHHRRPRSAGGSYTLDNAVTVCRACHDYLTRNPAWAYEQGWLLLREGGSHA